MPHKQTARDAHRPAVEMLSTIYTGVQMLIPTGRIPSDPHVDELNWLLLPPFTFLPRPSVAQLHLLASEACHWEV